METETPSPARERILATASSLFYAHGIRAVGVDRIIRDSQVAKATFYAHFPSKNTLIAQYLHRHIELSRASLRRMDESATSGDAAITALFEETASMAGTGSYHGCRFGSAESEHLDADAGVEDAARRYRDDVRAFLARHTSGDEATRSSRAETVLALYEGAKILALEEGRRAVERLIPFALEIAAGPCPRSTPAAQPAG